MKTLKQYIDIIRSNINESILDDEDEIISNTRFEDNYLKSQLYDIVSKTNHTNTRTYSAANFHLDYSTNTLEINCPINFAFKLILDINELIEFLKDQFNIRINNIYAPNIKIQTATNPTPYDLSDISITVNSFVINNNLRQLDNVELDTSEIKLVNDSSKPVTLKNVKIIGKEYKETTLVTYCDNFNISSPIKGVDEFTHLGVTQRSPITKIINKSLDVTKAPFEDKSTGDVVYADNFKSLLQLYKNTTHYFAKNARSYEIDGKKLTSALKLPDVKNIWLGGFYRDTRVLLSKEYKGDFSVYLS